MKKKKKAKPSPPLPQNPCGFCGAELPPSYSIVKGGMFHTNPFECMNTLRERIIALENLIEKF